MVPFTLNEGCSHFSINGNLDDAPLYGSSPGFLISSLLFPFPGLLLLLSYPKYPCQARDYKDSELKFEERVLGIAEGLAEASRPLPKWPKGAQAEKK